jgi:GT2 family glycosyltransferase
MIIYPIDGIYSAAQPVDVSVIVPLYKSRQVVQDQIRFWAKEQGVNVEIIYVDDRCPQKSKQAVCRTWNSRSDKHDFLVKLILSEKNLGFGGACNLGAYHARGKYLIFLNADTITAANWIKHIIEPFADEQIGIVGNLQIKDGGEHHGTIDGAGSEWIWSELSFSHIGRHCHLNDGIPLPMHPMNCPADVLAAGEREMVTGCCFAIRKKLFDDLGGFNFNYKRGYWEDSELNMAVREKGYKVYFTPHSVVYHKLSHSNIAQHEWQQANRNYFLNKWVDSGRLDKLIKAKRPVRNTKISNILLIRDSARGDVLMASAVAAALKKKHAGAKVHMLTGCPGIVQNNIHIDEIVTWESHEKYLYQYIVDLDGAYERRPQSNILECYADEAGVDVKDCELYIHTDEYDLPDGFTPGNYIVIHGGATNWVGRHLRPEVLNEFVQICSFHNIRTVCVGHGGDQELSCDLNLVGQTTVFEMAHVIQNAALFVGIDSMPMHIAQAVKTTGVAFFGSVRPDTRIINSNMHGVTAMDVPCLGCHHRKLAPSVVTNVCETGTLDCETKMTAKRLWNVSKNVGNFGEIERMTCAE